jgi:hypothetical protein
MFAMCRGERGYPEASVLQLRLDRKAMVIYDQGKNLTPLGEMWSVSPRSRSTWFVKARELPRIAEVAKVRLSGISPRDIVNELFVNMSNHIAQQIHGRCGILVWAAFLALMLNPLNSGSPKAGLSEKRRSDGLECFRIFLGLRQKRQKNIFVEFLSNTFWKKLNQSVDQIAE